MKKTVLLALILTLALAAASLAQVTYAFRVRPGTGFKVGYAGMGMRTETADQMYKFLAQQGGDDLANVTVTAVPVLYRVSDGALYQEVGMDKKPVTEPLKSMKYSYNGKNYIIYTIEGPEYTDPSAIATKPHGYFISASAPNRLISGREVINPTIPTLTGSKVNKATGELISLPSVFKKFINVKPIIQLKQ